MDATTSAMPAQTTERYGIYFGLPMEVYLADDALGSTDMRHLRRNPTSYWRNSSMNPKRVRKSKDYLTRGTAMHTMLFDGEGAFASLYMRGAVHTEDMTPSEKGAMTKEANKKAAAMGMTALPADDFERILEARTIIRMNPDMATSFSNGFAEVSVFWTRDGVRRKARIDYLKILGLGDLKSVANPYDIDFEECCRYAIARYRYDLQAAHYLEARAVITHWGRVGIEAISHGNYDAELLKKIAANEGAGWQWVFYCTEGPPDACSYKLVHGNPMIEGAQRDIEIAVSRYVRLKAQFGEKQWVLIKPPQHLTYDMMPGYFARMTPEEGEEYAEWMDSKGAPRTDQ